MHIWVITNDWRNDSLKEAPNTVLQPTLEHYMLFGNKKENEP